MSGFRDFFCRREGWIDAGFGCCGRGGVSAGGLTRIFEISSAWGRAGL